MSRGVQVDQHLVCPDTLMLSTPDSLYLQKGGKKHHSVLETFGEAAAVVCWEHPASLYSLRGRCNTVQIVKLTTAPKALFSEIPALWSWLPVPPEHCGCISLRNQWVDTLAISLNFLLLPSPLIANPSWKLPFSSSLQPLCCSLPLNTIYSLNSDST